MKERYLPEGALLLETQNRSLLESEGGLRYAKEMRITLESVALRADSALCLHFSLGGLPGVMPREEAALSAEGEETKDIAILTRVGKPVAFRVLDILEDEEGMPYALLSRRALQEECRREYIDRLSPGDIIPCTVTHLESFGAFVDIGCGIVSLLSIDAISVSRISHPKLRLTEGEPLSVVVRSVDERGRIFVSLRELLGTWEENAALFHAGETVAGIVRSVESYGVFVELTPNLAGLAEVREGVTVNRRAAVFIKSIIPEKMKIKLIIIDPFGGIPPKGELRYFGERREGGHIPYWRYSPASCPRLVETCFA